MKKQSFQGVLCVLAGILVAALSIAYLFECMNWPGGWLLTTVVVPALLLIEALGALKLVPSKKAEEDKKVKRQQMLEIIIIVSMLALALGMFFRGMHWPGGGDILSIACITLAVCSIWAGKEVADMIKKNGDDKDN